MNDEWDGARDRTALIIGSSSRPKILEFKSLLADLPLDVVGVSDVLPEKLAISETADSFEGNAIIKAKGVAEATLMLTLADDSGLEVEALGQRPGVRSSRFAHERATDAENNAALLAALADVESERRQACFRCVLALVDPFAPPGSIPMVASGTCQGFIARGPRGRGGFGYDPLFVVSGYDKTMAELTTAEKNAVSHRALAIRALRPSLVALVEKRLRDAERMCST